MTINEQSVKGKTMKENNTGDQTLGTFDVNQVSDGFGMLSVTLKQFYDSFVTTGFTPQQAFQLTRDYMLTLLAGKK